VNTRDEEIIGLKSRINELEKQLDNLRLSRRVLMDLLEQIEKEKNILSSQLQKRSKDFRRRKKISPKKAYSSDFELYNFHDYLKNNLKK